MILLVAALLGVMSVTVTGGRLRRIAVLPLRHVWVVWMAITMQIIVFGTLRDVLAEWATGALHLVTYAIALSFLWLNRHLPGAVAIGFGASLNVAAIAANGGTMPASPGAWRTAGFDTIPQLQNANSHVLESPRLALLGDVFAIPAAWPLSNVFSVGDIVIAVAVTYLAHCWCRTPQTSNAWPAPLASDRVAAELMHSTT